jgi:hypothetical protein
MSAPSVRYADDDAFNVAEVTTETPLLARCGESAGVIEHGMSKERRKYRNISTALNASLGRPGMLRPLLGRYDIPTTKKGIGRHVGSRISS